MIAREKKPNSSEADILNESRRSLRAGTSMQAKKLTGWRICVSNLGRRRPKTKTGISVTPEKGLAISSNLKRIINQQKHKVISFYFEVTIGSVAF